ncbi:hypothetical protein G5C60_38085 [Streptomyces sp. HC44]|uniref:Uncharacterized protein n=2 Tax=Streptomyces scabichelini TaxID=2711217 RepID=A0A6G4VHH0_9ACTN|nr:hypothetical protein [Streptomyces scabichelini]
MRFMVGETGDARQVSGRHDGAAAGVPGRDGGSAAGGVSGRDGGSVTGGVSGHDGGSAASASGPLAG